MSHVFTSPRIYGALTGKDFSEAEGTSKCGGIIYEDLGYEELCSNVILLVPRMFYTDIWSRERKQKEKETEEKKN